MARVARLRAKIETLEVSQYQEELNSSKLWFGIIRSRKKAAMVKMIIQETSGRSLPLDRKRGIQTIEDDQMAMKIQNVFFSKKACTALRTLTRLIKKVKTTPLAFNSLPSLMNC